MEAESFSFVLKGDFFVAKPANGDNFQIIVHELVKAIIQIVDVLEAQPMITRAKVLGGDDASAVTVVVAGQRATSIIEGGGAFQPAAVFHLLVVGYTVVISLVVGNPAYLGYIQQPAKVGGDARNFIIDVELDDAAVAVR